MALHMVSGVKLNCGGCDYTVRRRGKKQLAMLKTKSPPLGQKNSGHC